MTKYQLLTAFAERKPLMVAGKLFNIINKLEHENGSGKSFLVTGYVAGKAATVHVMTID
jgi:hypothetical protein